MEYNYLTGKDWQSSIHGLFEEIILRKTTRNITQNSDMAEIHTGYLLNKVSIVN